MDKNSFLIYLDYEEQFNLLTDEQIGQLMRAIIKYEKTKEEPQLDGMLKMAFSFIKTQLDRDREKYEKKCKKNKENGAKGGRPKNQKEEEKPNGFKENQSYPKKADNEEDNDKDNDNEDDKDSSSSINYYMENINPLISPYEVELLDSYCHDLSDEIVIYAIKDAIEHNAKNMKYIKKILDRYVKQGLSSIEQVKAQSNFNKQPKEETEEEKNARKLRELEEAIRNGT